MKTNLALIYKQLSKSDNSTIITKFEEQNRNFKYYLPGASSKQVELYVACYNSFKQYLLENNVKREVKDSYIYKMMFLFQTDDLDPELTLTNFDKFVNTYINNLSSLEAFLSEKHINEFYFPQNLEYANFRYDVTAMRAVLPRIGYTLLKNLENLEKIQKANGGVFPQEIAIFKNAALKAKFPNAEQNMKLAELCNLYDGNIVQFTEMLTLMKSGVLPASHNMLIPKAIDNLPKVIVRYVNEETGSNYYLVNLPSHDFRTMMLGNITGSCQTVTNGDADAFIIDGITRSDNGFYIIIKKGKKSFDPENIDWDNLEKNGHEIVFQSYTWIGRDGNSITLEAPQLQKDRAPNIDVKEIMDGFGKAVEEQGFDRITMGQHYGLQGAKNCSYDSTKFHNIIMEGERYCFSSREQFEVYASPRLLEIREQIQSMTGEMSVESITSVEQGKALLQFLLGKTLDPMMKKVLMSSYCTKEWNIEKLESLLVILESKTESELEALLQYQILYQYGLTIEYALKMPLEVIHLLMSLIPHNSIKVPPLFSLVSSLDELAKNILSARSVLDIKKEAVKLIAKNLGDEEEDFKYIDSMSESKIDFITINTNTMSIYLLYMKDYTVSRLAQVDEAKFDILKDFGPFIRIMITNQIGQTVQEFVDGFDSTRAMKGAIIKNWFNHPMKTPTTWDVNILDTLSEEKLDLLLKPGILEIFYSSTTLHAFLTCEMIILKKQILLAWAESNGLFENIADVNIPESHLDILISEEVMDFYEFKIKNLDPVIIGFFEQLENLVQLSDEKLQLLFTEESQDQCCNGVGPIEEIAIAIERANKTSIADTLKKHLDISAYQDILQRYDIDTLAKCLVTDNTVPSFITSDCFTPTQKLKILEKLLDNSLGDMQTEVINILCCIKPITDISLTRQKEITQYILDQKPLVEAATMLYWMNYVSPIILRTIDMELLVNTWRGSCFIMPGFLSNEIEENISIINHFGIDRLIKLNTQYYLINNICEVTNISVQDKITILAYVENMQDNTKAKNLLYNLSNLDSQIISTHGIENILHLLVGTNQGIKDLNANSLPDDIFSVDGMPDTVKIERTSLTPLHFSKIHIAEHIMLECGSSFTTDLPILGFYHQLPERVYCCESDGKYIVRVLGSEDVVLDHI